MKVKAKEEDITQILRNDIYEVLDVKHIMGNCMILILISNKKVWFNLDNFEIICGDKE